MIQPNAMVRTFLHYLFMDGFLQQKSSIFSFRERHIFVFVPNLRILSLRFSLLNLSPDFEASLTWETRGTLKND